MTKLNKALLASTAIAFAGGLALPASAQDAADAPAVVKSGKKMKIKLYGQIARGFGLVNDGENSQFRQGQLSTTNSRMGIDGRGKINKDWSLRTRWEFQLTGDGSFDPRQNQTGERDDGAFRIRHADAIFSNKQLGAIWIGRGDTASNGTSEVDLCPNCSTGHLGGSLHQVVNNVETTEDTSGNPKSGRTINDFFDSFDGAGRATRMRYDTPSFSGFKVSVGYIDATSWDAALRYSGGSGSMKVKGAVGFARIESAETGDQADYGSSQANTSNLSGSLSVRMGNVGATMSGAHRWRDAAGDDNAWNVNPSLWYVLNATEVGPTTLEGSFQYSKNITDNGDKGYAYAAIVHQYLKNVGTDTYLTARYYDVSQDGPDLNAVWFVGGGFRTRF